MMNSVFYQLQAHWFGVGRSPGTLATKTLVDQFLYTPFLSNPMQTLAFLWKSEQFSLSTDGRKDAAIPAILCTNRAAGFGVQLAFLDSDGGSDLLLPDFAAIAPGNFGVRYLELVNRGLG
jgi:hypothetical protein